MKHEELLKGAMQLSSDERAILAHRLFDSLASPSDPAIDAGWADEIERRIAAYDRGEIASVSADEAMAQLRQRRKSARPSACCRWRWMNSSPRSSITKSINRVLASNSSALSLVFDDLPSVNLNELKHVRGLVRQISCADFLHRRTQARGGVDHSNARPRTLQYLFIAIMPYRSSSSRCESPAARSIVCVV